MTLHTPLVLSLQQMGLMFFGYGQVIDKQISYVFKSRHLLGKSHNTLKVPFELARRMQFLFHFINSSIKLSTLSNVSLFFVSRASFIAATVSSFGSEYTASIRALSTKLLRLLFAFLACSCRTCNKSSRRRNEVCFLTTASISLHILYCNTKVIQCNHKSKYQSTFIFMLFPQ